MAMRRRITSLHERPPIAAVNVNERICVELIVGPEFSDNYRMIERNYADAVTRDREGYWCFWRHVNGLKDHWYELGYGRSECCWIITGGSLSYRIFHFHNEESTMRFKRALALPYEPTKVNPL